MDSPSGQPQLKRSLLRSTYSFKNSTQGFNSSILRHSGIGGTADETVLNIVHDMNLQAKKAVKTFRTCTCGIFQYSLGSCPLCFNLRIPEAELMNLRFR
jgi:thiamine pyrophosphokinase